MQNKPSLSSSHEIFCFLNKPYSPNQGAIKIICSAQKRGSESLQKKSKHNTKYSRSPQKHTRSNTQPRHKQHQRKRTEPRHNTYSKAANTNPNHHSTIPHKRTRTHHFRQPHKPNTIEPNTNKHTVKVTFFISIFSRSKHTGLFSEIFACRIG